MSDLRRAVEDYIAVRRALGSKLQRRPQLLENFVAFLEAAGATTVTTELADLAVFRPSTATWFVQKSAGGSIATGYGAVGDIEVPGDYDGDGRNDLAVYRPSTATWFWQNSSTGTDSLLTYGTASDKRAQGDYDGDGKTDVAIFRDSLSTWYIRNSATNTDTIVTFGLSGDLPVTNESHQSVGDYDADGRADRALVRSPSTFFLHPSATATHGDDSRGNRTSRTQASEPDVNYGYDQANRLTSARGATYSYDGEGLRRSKTTAAGTTSFGWDEAQSLLLTQTTAGSTTSFIYGPGGLPLERIDAAGNVIWYYQDQLGSTRVLTNARAG